MTGMYKTDAGARRQIVKLAAQWLRSPDDGHVFCPDLP